MDTPKVGCRDMVPQREWKLYYQCTEETEGVLCKIWMYGEYWMHYLCSTNVQRKLSAYCVKLWKYKDSWMHTV